MSYKAKVKHPDGRLQWTENTFEALNNRIINFVNLRWNSHILGGRSLPSRPTPGDNVRHFFKNMDGYECEMVLETSASDDIELTPVEVEILRRAVRYGRDHTSAIGTSMGLQSGEVFDTLSKIIGQLKD